MAKLRIVVLIGIIIFVWRDFAIRSKPMHPTPKPTAARLVLGGPTALDLPSRERLENERVSNKPAKSVSRSFGSVQYIISFQEARSDAHRGRVFGEVMLGTMYHDGLVVSKDDKKAFYWIHKAALLRYPGAGLYLANFYDKGEGVERNATKAAKWYLHSSDRGNVEAQFKLGILYEKGSGIPKNHVLGTTLIARAAAHGNLDALKFLETGAGNGNSDMENKLGIIDYDSGGGIFNNRDKNLNLIDGEQVGDLKKHNEYSKYQRSKYIRSARWLEKAARQGNVCAENNIGFLYERGIGVKQNFRSAVKWFEKALIHQSKIAEYRMAYNYENGYGVERNYIAAFNFYRAASKSGYLHAQYALSKMYYDGIGVPQNFVEAYKWLLIEKASSDPNRPAYSKVGRSLDVLSRQMDLAQIARAQNRAKILSKIIMISIKSSLNVDRCAKNR